MSAVVGIWGNQNAALKILLGLYRLLHKGMKYLGIVMAASQKEFQDMFRLGPLTDILDNPPDIMSIGSLSGIGIVGNHIQLDMHSRLAQPFHKKIRNVPFAICVSGVITNQDQLRRKIENNCFLGSDSIAELVAHLVNRSGKKDLLDRIFDALSELEGSFAVLILTPDFLVAARDPLGNRPLSLGSLPDGGIMVATETTAFGPVNAVFLKDIEPGEAVVISNNEIIYRKFARSEKLALCSLEVLRLASPDSGVYGGKSIGNQRKELGKKAGEQKAIIANCIIPTPKAVMPFVQGLTEVLAIPIAMAIDYNDKIVRGSLPDSIYLDVKFKFVGSLITGKRVLVVDDILFSFRTARHLVKSLWDTGLVEVIQFLASCPPVNRDLCPFRWNPAPSLNGSFEDFKDTELPRFLCVNSFDFLNLSLIREVIGPSANDFCYRCLQG